MISKGLCDARKFALTLLPKGLDKWQTNGFQTAENVPGCDLGQSIPALLSFSVRPQSSESTEAECREQGRSNSVCIRVGGQFHSNSWNSTKTFFFKCPQCSMKMNLFSQGTNLMHWTDWTELEWTTTPAHLIFCWIIHSSSKTVFRAFWEPTYWVMFSAADAGSHRTPGSLYGTGSHILTAGQLQPEKHLTAHLHSFSHEDPTGLQCLLSVLHVAT